MLIKPKKLKPGDTVATVSPSWGGAGDPNIRWRYDQGVKRLEEVFGLNVVAMPHSLKGSEYLYDHPEARAEDLNNAFQNDEIKGIFANIGGEESIRLLPYIDFDVIRQNPKIFMGYSDITILHLICLKAGLSSFYGPAVLVDFAENIQMDPYTIDMIKRALFSADPIGEIKAPAKWTSEYLEWDISNKNTRRKMYPNQTYELIQGNGIVTGHLIGGCIEVLEFAKGTPLWPKEQYWQDSILFFETSEEKTEPQYIRYWLRNYAAQGILHKCKGIIFAKPYGEVHYNAYKKEIKKVLTEYGLNNLPVLYNLTFGHTEPMFAIPYGARAEINCDEKTFTILESGVI